MAKRRGSSVQVAIEALRARERELHAELASLKQALEALGSGARSSLSPAASPVPSPRKNRMSATGRAAIARAAKRRWAAWRKAKAQGKGKK